MGDRQLEVTHKPFCEMLAQCPQSAFQGVSGGRQGGLAAVCDPNPTRPFVQYGQIVAPIQSSAKRLVQDSALRGNQSAQTDT